MIRTGWKETKFRLRYAVFAAGFHFLGYGISNHYPVKVPTHLPWMPSETLIPFLPETFWIYLSAVPMLFAYFMYEEDRKKAVQYLFSYLGLVTMSVIVFVFFPTVYPRELYPVSGFVDPVLQGGFDVLRLIDSPTNCFPSLHVGGATLVALVSWERKDRISRYFPVRFSHFMLVWTSLVTLSTLTTKQHYLLDVVSGWAFGYVAYALFFRNQEFMTRVGSWLAQQQSEKS